MNKIILKPVTDVKNDQFTMYSNITSSNSRVVLNKEEAMLLYIELHRFIFTDKECPECGKSDHLISGSYCECVKCNKNFK
jgi:transposase-like protein